MSTRLLLFAIVATVAAVAGGQWLVWGVYSASVDPQAVVAEQSNVEPLVVGVGRTPGGPGEWATYARAFAQVERDLGRPVSVRYARTRGDMREDVVAGRVDVALVSIIEYLELRDADAAVLVASPVVGGATLDQAVLVSGTNTSRSRPSSDTVLVSKGSLASEAYARWLRDRNEPSERPVASITAGATQELILEDVAKGKAWGACVNRSAIAVWPANTFELRAASPEFGMAPVVARVGLDPQVVADVRTSLLSLASRRKLPQHGVVTGFVAVDDASYDFPAELRPWLLDDTADDPAQESQ